MGVVDQVVTVINPLNSAISDAVDASGGRYVTEWDYEVGVAGDEAGTAQRLAFLRSLPTAASPMPLPCLDENPLGEPIPPALSGRSERDIGTMNEALPQRAPDRTSDTARRMNLALGTSGFDGFTPLAWSNNTGVRVLDAPLVWDPSELASVPVGRAWDVLRMDRARGRRTVTALSTAGATIGPALHSPGGYIDVFIPVGSLDDWDQDGAAVLPKDTPLSIPHPTVVSPKTLKGRSWIVPPKGPTLTEGVALYEAYAAAGAGMAMERCTDVCS